MKKPIKKIKPCTAYAIVKKRTMKISALDIFADKDIEVGDDELLVRVTITAK